MKQIEFNFFGDTNVGKVRDHNEDCLGNAETPNGYLYVVCDGMGGHAAGEVASEIAVQSIITYLQKTTFLNIKQALYEALQFANQQILGYASEHPESKGMGTTACVLLVQHEQAWIAHAGDSRIYLYLGKEKQLHRITKDHSFVQTLVDMGEITDAEAEFHPNKNRILKALGIKPDLQPEVSLSPVFPKKDDVFLICSDGLSGMVDDLNMEGVLTKNTAIAEKGEELIQMALYNGGVDNVTLQLIQVNSSPYKQTVFVSKNPKGRPQNFSSDSAPRKKKLSTLIIVLLCILVVVIGFVLALFVFGNESKESIDKKIKEKTKEINLYKHNLDSINKIYESDLTSYGNLIKERGDKDKDNDLFGRMANNKTKIEKLNEKIKSAEDEKASLEKKYEQKYEKSINPKNQEKK